MNIPFRKRYIYLLNILLAFGTVISAASLPKKSLDLPTQDNSQVIEKKKQQGSQNIYIDLKQQVQKQSQRKEKGKGSIELTIKKTFYPTDSEDESDSSHENVIAHPDPFESNLRIELAGKFWLIQLLNDDIPDNVKPILNQSDREILGEDLTRGSYNRFITWMTMDSWSSKLCVALLARKQSITGNKTHKQRLWPRSNALPLTSHRAIRRIMASMSFLDGMDFIGNHLWSWFFLFFKINDLYAHYGLNVYCGGSDWDVWVSNSPNYSIFSHLLLDSKIWGSLLGITLGYSASQALFAACKTEYFGRGEEDRKSGLIQAMSGDTTGVCGSTLVVLLPWSDINTLLGRGSRVLQWDARLESDLRQTVLKKLIDIAENSDKLAQFQAIWALAEISHAVALKDFERLRKYGLKEDMLIPLLQVKLHALRTLRGLSSYVPKGKCFNRYQKMKALPRYLWANYNLWHLGHARSHTWDLLFWPIKGWKFYAKVMLAVSVAQSMQVVHQFYKNRQKCKQDGKDWRFIQETQQYSCTTCGDSIFQLPHTAIFSTKSCWETLLKHPTSPQITVKMIERLHLRHIEEADFSHQVINDVFVQQVFPVLIKQVGTIRSMKLGSASLPVQLSHNTTWIKIADALDVLHTEHITLVVSAGSLIDPLIGHWPVRLQKGQIISVKGGLQVSPVIAMNLLHQVKPTIFELTRQQSGKSCFDDHRNPTIQPLLHYILNGTGGTSSGLSIISIRDRSGRFLEYFAQKLTLPSTVERISFKKSCIGSKESKTAAYIGAVIGQSKYLQSFDLSDNQIGYQDCKGIAALGLGIGNNTNLRSLYLSRNCIGCGDSKCVEVLGQGIGNSTNLQSFDLSYNYVGYQGSEGTTALGQGIGESTNLQFFDLSQNKIITIPETLGQGIGNSTNLQSFDLSHNEINLIPGALGQGIGNSINLQSFDLSHNKIIMISETLGQGIGSSTSLQFFDLSQNGIGYYGSQGTKVLGQGIESSTSLRSFDLSGNQIGSLDSKGTIALGVGIWNSANLRSFDLSGNNIGSQDSKGTTALGQGIGNSTSLRFFNLGRNNIGSQDSKGTMALGWGIGESASLRSFDLSENKIGFKDSKGTTVLGWGIGNTSLQSFDLSENQIGYWDFKGTKSLIQGIKKSTHLITLKIDGNYLTSTIAHKLNQIAFSRNITITFRNQLIGIDSLEQIAQNLSTITHLKLDEKGDFGSIAYQKAIFNLSHAISQSKSLRSFDLSHNDIGKQNSKGIELLGQSIENSTNLQSFYLSGNAVGSTGYKGTMALGKGIERSVNLQSFDLSENNIGSSDSKGLIALGRGIGKSTSLRSFDLSSNSIHGKINCLYFYYECHFDSSGIEALGQGIGNSTSLKSFDLSRNKIGGSGSKGVEALGRGIGKSINLQFFDLSDNMIGTSISTFEGIKALGWGIGNSPHLRSFDLNGNQIGSGTYKNIEILSQGMIKATGLRSFGLSSNEIGYSESKSAVILGQVIRNSTSLQSFDLSHNYIGAQGSRGTVALGQSIGNSTSLQSFDLSDNYISSKDSKGVEALGLGIGSSTNLQSFDLSSNQIGTWDSKGTIALGWGISNSTSLQSFDLKWNEIGSLDSKGTAVLGWGIGNSTSLQSFSLDHNNIGYHDTKGVITLFEGISKSNVTHAVLSHNPICQQGEQPIRKLATLLSKTRLIRLELTDLSPPCVSSTTVTSLLRAAVASPWLQFMDLSRSLNMSQLQPRSNLITPFKRTSPIRDVAPYQSHRTLVVPFHPEIGNGQLSIISQSLSRSSWSDVQMPFCNISHNGIYDFFTQLPESKVNMLDLRWNQLDDFSAVTIADSLVQWDMGICETKMMDWMVGEQPIRGQSQTHLTQLRLEGNYIGHRGIQALCQALIFTEIDIAGVGLDKQEIPYRPGPGDFDAATCRLQTSSASRPTVPWMFQISFWILQSSYRGVHYSVICLQKIPGSMLRHWSDPRKDNLRYKIISQTSFVTQSCTGHHQMDGFCGTLFTVATHPGSTGMFAIKRLCAYFAAASVGYLRDGMFLQWLTGSHPMVARHLHRYLLQDEAQVVTAMAEMTLRLQVPVDVAVVHDLTRGIKHRITSSETGFWNKTKGFITGLCQVGYHYVAGPILQTAVSMIKKTRQGYRKGGVLGALDQGSDGLMMVIPGGHLIAASLDQQTEAVAQYQR